MNAAAIAAAGCGQSLQPDDPTGQALQTAAARLLDEPGFIRAAGTDAESIAAMPGLDNVVGVLERVAARAHD